MKERFRGGNRGDHAKNFAQNRAEVAQPLDRFHINPTDYPIFVKQRELDEHWGNNTEYTWNIDRTASVFISNTAKLIATIDGTAQEYARDDAPPKPDHVIYLDKSARPVSWFVNVFWKDFSENERPAHSYLNIDRQPWFRLAGTNVDASSYITDPDGTKRPAILSDFKIENVPPEVFARIRSIYLPGGIEHEDPGEIMQTPSSLDGKNILIVDEVKRSGATLGIAKQLIEKAFPEAASVKGTYFWSSSAKSSPDGTESQMLSVPVWYKSHEEEGRGIGDINNTYHQTQHDQYQTPRTRARSYGSLVLGAVINLETEKGQLSRELMREIKQMHQDFSEGKILFRPPDNYDFERADACIEAQGLRLAPASDHSPDTYLNVKRAIDSRPADY